MSVVTYRQAVTRGIADALAADPDVFLFGEDVARAGGAFKTTDGIWERFGDERVLDTPISEQAIVGTAIGAAIRGLRPLAEVMFADFAAVCFDGIVNELAKYRYRSGGEYPAKVVIRTPVGGGIRGGHYHSQHPEAAFIHVAGLKVVCPSNPHDAKGLLLASIQDPDPVIFFEPKRVYRAAKMHVPDDEYVVPLTSAKVVRDGEHVTLLAWGAMLYEALAAAEEAAQKGVQTEVIDLRTLRPLDTETILESVRKTSKVLIVHEDNLIGGLGGEVAALIGQHAFEHLDAPIMRIGGPEVPGMPYSDTLEHAFLPNVETIAAAMRELAEY